MSISSARLSAVVDTAARWQNRYTALAKALRAAYAADQSSEQLFLLVNSAFDEIQTEQFVLDTQLVATEAAQCRVNDKANARKARWRHRAAMGLTAAREPTARDAPPHVNPLHTLEQSLAAHQRPAQSAAHGGPSGEPDPQALAAAHRLAQALEAEERAQAQAQANQELP